MTFEFTAELLAVTTTHFSVGMLAFMGVWFANFLFGGMLVKDDDVLWPLRLTCYILPMRYGTQSIAYEEFIDSTWAGAISCNSTETTCSDRGFICDSRPCYGQTGTQVLDSLHIGFNLISSENRTVQSIMYMLIYCLVMKVLYIMRIMWMIKRK